MTEFTGLDMEMTFMDDYHEVRTLIRYVRYVRYMEMTFMDD